MTNLRQMATSMLAVALMAPLATACTSHAVGTAGRGGQASATNGADGNERLSAEVLPPLSEVDRALGRRGIQPSSMRECFASQLLDAARTGALPQDQLADYVADPAGSSPAPLVSDLLLALEASGRCRGD